MSQSPIIIEATIRRGFGAAAECIRRQKPFIAPIVPGFEKCQNGTINLLLDQPLRVVNPDVTTGPIAWAGPGFPPEIFGIQPIEFEYPIGDQHHPAWIYIPHNSPHFHDVLGVEIVAPPIPDVKPSARCRIHIPKPHRLEPVIVI